MHAQFAWQYQPAGWHEVCDIHQSGGELYRNLRVQLLCHQAQQISEGVHLACKEPTLPLHLAK